MICGHCGARNADGHQFCATCGKGLGPTCGGCGAPRQPGARFCTGCGAKFEAPARSVVADGVWQRDPAEIARRVSRDELRSAFGGSPLDGWFAGTLVGAAVDALAGQGVTVPPGSVGALVRDGAVVRVLPPGEQVTPRTLREALQDAWAGAARTSLVLVDRRPLAASLSRTVATAQGAVDLELTATFTVPATPAALAAFADRVLGDRPALTGGELHTRLRAELEQAADDALRGGDVRGAAAACQDALRRGALAGTGLAVEVTAARRGTTHRLALTLADLLTADAERVELDVVAEVQGDRPPSKETAPWAAAAAAWLRGRPWAEVATADGFAALGEVLTGALAGHLAATGHTLDAVVVVDARAALAAATQQSRAALALAQAAARAALAEREARLAEGVAAAALAERERAIRTAERDAAHGEALSGAALEHARRMQQLGHGAEADRARAEAESLRRRREAEDADHADRLRREARLAELTAMAALEAQLTEREHRHELDTMARLEGKTEAQMLAMQAGKLASAEHGAAFADALGKLADGEAARRERERADARLDARDERTMQLVEKMLSATAPKPPGPRTCGACGAVMAPAAKFCGVCGGS